MGYFIELNKTDEDEKIYLFFNALDGYLCVSSLYRKKQQPSLWRHFFTEEGVRFELKADSTTLIQFNDSLTYEGTWQVCKSADNLEYATIEFAGYPAYYFLKDGKLYRSEREMRNDVLGRRINYPK